MSLVPVPSAESGAANCANCGAALVADQRYCLSCGQPVSPVRLAFLDVLEREESRAATAPAWSPHAAAVELGPAGYAQLPPEQGAGAWLRRNQGLLSLLSVLALCLLVGLLVGHWVTQGKPSSGPQIVKVEGLAAAPAAATTPSSTSGTSSAGAKSSSAAKEEAEEEKEAAKETKAEKTPPPPPVKVAPQKLQKLSTSTGKKHEEEINSLGAKPIETG